MDGGGAAAGVAPPLRAAWVRDGSRRHVLLDGGGAPQGWLQLQGATLQRAAAEVGGAPAELRATRLLRLRLTATGPGGGPLLRLTTDLLRWRGRAEVPDRAPLPVRAGPVRGGDIAIGGPPVLLAREADRDRLDVAVDPAVLRTAPVLVAAALLIALHRREQSESA